MTMRQCGIAPVIDGQWVNDGVIDPLTHASSQHCSSLMRAIALNLLLSSEDF